MKAMPAYEYQGYTVVVNALPAPGNRYSSVFSVHRGSRSGGEGMRQLPVAYQEGHDAGVICETAEEAHQDAAARANEWIDEHPIE